MGMNEIFKTTVSCLIFALLLLGCSPTPANTAVNTEETLAGSTEERLISDSGSPPSTDSPAFTGTATKTDTPTKTPSLTATPDLRLEPEDWQAWPVIPTVSANAKAIYERGLASGNHPDRFSKIGDCQNITTYFLAIFDEPKHHRLGSEYAYLQEAIDHFSGSFSRESISTAGGMNVAAVLSRYWVVEEQCKNNESPLACELRLHQPSIALISMEESWGRDNKVENYEKYMRQIIEIVIESGAIPILATKADNKEGDHQINQAIAELAYEYDIPLWNFWSAVQPLPNHGLLEDGFHLTHGLYYFDEPRNLKQAWPMRNLTALQVIDSVWRQANDLPLGPE